MNDITSRWNGSYYLTADQYEGTTKFFKDIFKGTTLQLNPSTDINSTTKIGSVGTTGAKSCMIIEKNMEIKYKNLTLHNLWVKRIIFNPPATVVIWEDDTKTVVKCSEDDEFNPEIGVAMCYMKKIYGNRHAFSKMIESYIEE